jgi:hypothetical protein
VVTAVSTFVTTEGWQPFDEAALRRALDGFGGPWWVSGRHAIDLLLGRETRPHGDVDVVVLRLDQGKLYAHLEGWDLRYATPDRRLEPWHGDWVELPVHAIWARPNADLPWFCELLLNEVAGDEWFYRRDPRARRPLAELGVTSPSGLPVLALLTTLG